MRDLPNLSVQQLEYFVAVHEAPTWGDAAAAVGVTPSALSQGLAELERRLGVVLFERDGRRRVPTAAAATVLDHAHAVLARTQDLARWAQRRRAGTAGAVRVGMIDAAATIHCAPGLAAFRAARPDVDVRLQVSPSGELLRDLTAARLDVVVCVAPADVPEGVTVAPLLDEDLAVYAPVDAAPRAWGPWVTYPVGSQTRALIDDALRRAGRPVTIVAESHQPEVLAQMVALGLGWTVLPVAQVQRSGVELRRVGRDAFVRRSLVVARRADGPADPAVDALVTAIGC
ncbi:MAG TPA: LysR family transcriptional regulator [Acidimicrobiales bacterium]|nr:LysR family transcriptional regulator [Acidimicrobiales bacterium]